MSIIYDALKKVEQSNIKGDSRQEDSLKGHAKHRLKIYLLYVLVVCAGFFAVNIFFTFLSHPKIVSKVDIKSPVVATIAKQENKREETKVTTLAQQNNLQPAIVQPASSASPVTLTSGGMLVLNGIFFSQEEGYALVNNHIVKVGDKVEGALVKRIDVSEVELEVDGSSVRLNTAQR